MTFPIASRKAVALRYQKETDATPRVVASGQGWMAERIIQVGIRNGIPQLEDKPLVEALCRVTDGREIPTALYRAVAEALAFAYHVSGKR